MSYELQITELLRENGGLKERIGKLERTVAFLLANSGLTYVDKPDELPFADVTALAHKGDKLGAIKLYRQQTGASLADAERFVSGL